MSSERYQFASQIMKHVTRGATIDQKWDQAGPGGGKGYQQINQHVNKLKNKTQTQKGDQMFYFFICGDFFQNGGFDGSEFTDVLWKEVIQMLHKA